jgi:NADH-quinone oxidoreductase subunit L
LFSAYNSESGGKALYAVGLFAAVLTSFYMFRLIWLTFFGEKRYDEHHVHVHESPLNMTVPLMILAFLSLTGGWFAAPALWGGKDYFSEFLSPVFGAGEAVGREASASLEHWLSIVAVIAATAGLLVAWQMYKKNVQQGKSEGLHKLLYNKYYVDEIYQAAIVSPLVWLSRNVLWKVVDAGVIDGTVNGVAHGAEAVGDTLRHTQSGNTRSYAVWVIVGALVIFAIIFWPILHPALFGGVR